MYKAEELDPRPKKIIVEFNKPIYKDTLKTGETLAVHNVVINDPDSAMYHTYGHGLISYYFEWFSTSARPLKKYSIVFDTTEIKSVRFDY